MFVDIHNHVLNGIDDGADSIETSIEMLRLANEEGISKIIATPHFIYGAIDNTNDYIKTKFSEFKRIADERGINIELYSGSEVFISPETSLLVADGTICRLNASKYVLIEFPMLSLPQYLENVLFQLQIQGYKPIIAHPERNKVFQQYPDRLYELVERGILTQVNSSSIDKVYGKNLEKVAMEFIEAKLVHFIASDAHTCSRRAPRMKNAYEKVRMVCGKEVADNLFIHNGIAVIENRDLHEELPIKASKRGFGFITKLLRSH